MSKFCIRLKELRISRDLSQQKLADIVGISKSSINMYERGEREPGLELLETFADYFNVDMDYLLGKCDIPRKNLLINSIAVNNLDIGNRLKALRERQQLTQEEVGKYIGVTKATINRYETGEINIKRTAAIKLAKVLKTTPQYIMGWLDDAVPTKDKILSPDRNIKNYYKLNSVGKNKVGAYIDDLLCNPQYVYDKPVEMVAYGLDDMIDTGWKPKKPETTAD